MKDIIDFCDADRDRLEPGEWLNDCMIDLWLRWISKDQHLTGDNSCHFFTSLFYTMLSTKGPDSVAKWSAAKQLNVFEKRYIFIPVNESLHWSLAVVVNPGEIVRKHEEKEVSKQ